MKGDRVERAVDAGDTTRAYGMAASAAGCGVEPEVRRGVVEVREVTIPHGLEGMGGGPVGSVVRTARFMAAGVPALVEQPGPRPDASGRPLRASPPGVPSGRPLRDDPKA